MSWSSNVRVLGACGLWLALQVGCGGNPSVGGGSDTVDGGTAGTSKGGNGGNAGTLVLPMGGDTGDAGSGEEPTTTYVCGNGELEPREFCDDGNTEDGDGCSADCTLVDEEYDCSVVGEECVKVVVCGNGVIEGKEVCDDGNELDDDGCTADCLEVEEGFGCIRPGEACVKLSVCGNGERERGEQCDDGRPFDPDAPADGCDENCQIEPDYFCPIAGEPCVKEVCGDGKRTKNEACDNLDTEGCVDCQVQPGWHCNTSACKPECGDGMVVGPEQCDDKNVTGGDGCSSTCKIEPFHTCDASEPSQCRSTIECGNGVVDPGEACDDGKTGSATCTAACKPVPVMPPAAVCGNGVIEGSETCEPKNPGKGCSNTCQVEPGYSCTPGAGCSKNPVCGDGTVDIAQGEACDPPQVGNGCSATCKVESGWTCSGFGPSVCTKPVCGNGIVEPGEKCDDTTPGNVADGCINCQISVGWVCPSAGKPCQAICGDGMKLGTEECDDGGKSPNDGCSPGCKVEPGWKCEAGKACERASCGDGKVDSGEGCDDGNQVAGDGCGPTCQKEPTITRGTNPTVATACGDGLITGLEACDDGNKLSGDGCKSDCTLETPGWTCTEKVTLPKTFEMAVTYRDFKAGNAKTGDGHTDFQYQHLSHVAGLTGAPCKTANAGTCGRLDSAGKPQLIAGHNRATSGIMNADTFKLWWRDNNNGNVKNALGNNIAMLPPFPGTLTLTQQGTATSQVYVYDSKGPNDADGNHFYPLDGKGFGPIGTEVNLCNRSGGTNNGVTNVTGSPACDDCPASGCQKRNFNFTTELRYFFQYKGGETLSFTGDDDVWVYINGRLAVDIGGVHEARSGQVVLGDDGNGVAGEDSNCSAHGVVNLPNPTGGCYTASEQSNNIDDRFGLVKGELYEIVLFHAERHTTASNFKLTLAGFLAPRTYCTSQCGDGHRVGDEFCDDGANNSNTKAGACRTDCTLANFCGDGIKQAAGSSLPAETCDDGTNTTLYTKVKMTPVVACAPGCLAPAYCGDGLVQSGQGEQCDNGAANNDNAYSPGCKTDCTFGGYCGDGKVNGGTEVCDRGAMNGKETGPNSCTYNCQPGPYCGNGKRDPGEECDDGVNNDTPTSHCSDKCELLPYCGDGVKQGNEECDFGPFASTEYGSCTTLCLWGPMCGDGGPGNTPDPEEECDYGTAGNTGGYDGCTNKCGLGPHCGDGIKNGPEACDNGFNEDEYSDPGAATPGCGLNCTPVPYCGDGLVQANYEFCDYGAPGSNPDHPEGNQEDSYGGCTEMCEFGRFCGDGVIDDDLDPKTGERVEMCDDGKGNVGYRAKKGGCSYDCQPAPYCGDGIRNGPEQCDSPDGNDGKYGGCNADCTFAPRCGDGVKQGSEQCDDGPSGSLSCTPTCRRRNQVE